MLDLNNFQSIEEHEKITKIEAPGLELYKTVAFLHLGKFEEALKICQKDSFEHAYALYKLKKYKKALKIINKHNGENWDVLKSQVLYGLGFFNKAYKSLNCVNKDDEIVVNLQAIKSMGILTDKVNSLFEHKLYIKKKEDFTFKESLENYKFSNEEIYYEFLYNKTFECADKRSEYLDMLKKLSYKFPKAEIIKTQMSNIEGYFEEINVEDLNKTQKQVYDFNTKKADTVENGLHFLINFSSKLSDNQYKWIQHIKNNNYKINWNEIPNTSEVCNILRILVGLVNKNIKPDNIKKCLTKITNKDVKKKIEEYLIFA